MLEVFLCLKKSCVIYSGIFEISPGGKVIFNKMWYFKNKRRTYISCNTERRYICRSISCIIIKLIFCYYIMENERSLLDRGIESLDTTVSSPRNIKGFTTPPPKD